jgi:hypothetical protein
MQKVVEQNAKVGESFKGLKAEGGKAADSIGTSFDKSLNSLKAMAVSAVGFDAAMQTVSKTQQKFVTQMQESVNLVKELASAQQEAAKNLAGNDGQKIAAALQLQVPGIAKSASFSDLSKLTTALGSVVSIVGQEKAGGIVDVAAKLTRNKKDELQTTATALADITKVSGIADPRQVVSLALSSGSIARPEQMAKLSQGMAKAIASGISANPNQNKVEAAKSSSALFSLFTELDPEGLRASNADANFETQLGSFFNPNRDETAKRDERIQELLKEQAVTVEEQVAIDRANLSIKQKEAIAKRLSPTDMRPGAKDIRLDLDEAKASLFRAQKASKLSDKETEELRRLQVVKAATAKDPGSTVGRLQAIATNPELARDFEASISIEQIFKPMVKGLIDMKSDYFKKFKANLATVTTDKKVYDEGMASMTNTPQQKLALSMEKAATANAIKNFGDVETQTYGVVDKIVQDALKENPNVGLNAIGESFSQWGFERLGLGGEASVSSNVYSPEQAINSAILTLRDRQADVGDWATSDPNQMSVGARNKRAALQGSIDSLEQMKADLLGKAADRMAKAAEETAKAMAGQNEMMTEQNRILEAIKQQGGNPNPNAIRAQAEQSKQ